MRVTVEDDTGECFSYDTNKNSNCLFPAQDEIPKIAQTLQEASIFLTEPAQRQRNYWDGVR